jgi:ERCC4-related helicase
MTSFRARRARVLCATDVAARGLDIVGVQLVIHFDAPVMLLLCVSAACLSSPNNDDDTQRDPVDYVHRTGRTARAGRRGTALALVAPHDVKLVRCVAVHWVAGGGEGEMCVLVCLLRLHIEVYYGACMLTANNSQIQAVERETSTELTEWDAT